MNNTISIKREFSIYNEDYIQFIMEMENGATWSIVQVGGCWSVIKCKFDFITKEVYDHAYGVATTLPTLSDVRDFIWSKTNNIEENVKIILRNDPAKLRRKNA